MSFWFLCKLRGSIANIYHVIIEKRYILEFPPTHTGENPPTDEHEHSHINRGENHRTVIKHSTEWSAKKNMLTKINHTEETNAVWCYSTVIWMNLFLRTLNSNTGFHSLGRERDEKKMMNGNSVTVRWMKLCDLWNNPVNIIKISSMYPEFNTISCSMNPYITPQHLMLYKCCTPIK